MRQILSRLLQVRRDEGGLMVLALSFAFTSVAQTVVIRIFADAVLLTHFSAAYLPAFFISSSIAFMLVSVGYASGLSRVSSAKLNGWLLGGLAAFALLARPLDDLLGTPFVFFLCLALTVAAPLVRIACWNAITECFDTRQAKRLLPIAGAGSTVGAIVAGLVAAPYVRALGTDDLLYVIAGLFVAMAPIPRLLARKALVTAPVGRAPGAVRGAREGYLRSAAMGFVAMRRNRLVAVVGAALTLSAVVTILLDYSLKTALQREFSKDQISVFLGHFHALINGLILVLQLFVVGRVLVGFGIRLVFSLLPVALLVGAGFMALEPAFAVIVALNFVDLLLRYTFQNAAIEMVLTPVPSLERNRSKVVIKGVMVPAGWLLAGLLLLPIRELWPSSEGGWATIGWVCLGLLFCWMVLVFRVRGHYIGQLRNALGFGRVIMSSAPDMDALLQRDAVKRLLERLEHGDPEDLKFSLDLLAGGLRHIPEARRVLGNASPLVRAAALKAIGAHKLTRHRRRVLELLEHESDSRVLREGLLALRNIGAERAAPVASRYADHADLAVRAEALGVLYHGSDGEDPRPRQMAERWIRGTPEERRLAAYLIGEMGWVAPQTLTPPRATTTTTETTNTGAIPVPWDLAALGELLSDHDERVRLAAYEAVGRAEVHVYVPRLVQALGARDEAPAAARALRAFGAAAVGPMAKVCRNRNAPRSLRYKVIQTLGLIEVTEAVFVLIDLLPDWDAEVRRLAVISLHRLKRSVNPRAFLQERIIDSVVREIRIGHLCFGLVAESHRQDMDEFFTDEVQWRLRGAAEQIFELLGLIHDAKVMRALHRRYRIGPAPVRANTLELLENVVSDELRRPLIRLLEDAPLGEREARAREEWVLEGSSSFATVLLDSTDDRWLQKCFLYVSRPEVLRRYPSNRREVEQMVPLLERVILLKSVPLFSALSGETLYPIAEIAESLQVAQGTTIFQEGDPGNYLYVVVRGEVQILKGGSVVTLRLPREAFGEMALLDDSPRSAAAVAHEDCELLRISSEPFGDLLDQHTEISRGIIRVLLSYVRGEGGPSPV